MKPCPMVVVGASLVRLAKDTDEIEVVEWFDEWHMDAKAEGEPEMVLVDADADGLRGEEGLTQIKQRFGRVPLLVVMPGDDPELLAVVSELGVSGILKKPVHRQDLLNAVEVVRAGGSYIDPQEAMQMVEAVTSGGKELTEVNVTDREKQVLELLAQGLSARQIARDLDLSERTINTHVANLYRKLGVSNRVAAIRSGIRLKIISPP